MRIGFALGLGDDSHGHFRIIGAMRGIDRLSPLPRFRDAVLAALKRGGESRYHDWFRPGFFLWCPLLVNPNPRHRVIIGDTAYRVGYGPISFCFSFNYYFYTLRKGRGTPLHPEFSVFHLVFISSRDDVFSYLGFLSAEARVLIAL